MPTFEIPEGPTNVELQQTGDPKSPGPSTGSAVFNVTNKTTESRGASLSVQVAGSSKKEWFAIEGDQVRTFAPGETQTAKINISVPKDAAAGDYPFRLRAAAENDTDNDFADGPVSAAKKKRSANGGGGVPWWVWLIIALVVLSAVGGAVWWFLHQPRADPDPPIEHNEVIPAGNVPVPNFVDKPVDQAKQEAQGFTIVEAPGDASGKAPKTILSQIPAAGTKQAPGALVQVKFDPGVSVPSVVGQEVATAVRTLQNAGLHIESSSSRCEPAGTPDQIVDQDPKAGNAVAKGLGVKVVVRTVGGRFGTVRIRCGFIISPTVLQRVEGVRIRDHRLRDPQ